VRYSIISVHLRKHNLSNGLDWDRDDWSAGVVLATNEWGRLGGWDLLLQVLELLNRQAWQNRLNDQLTVGGDVALDLALGQISSVVLWDDKLAGVRALNLVLLVNLGLVLALNVDRALLRVDLNLDLLWLEALDVKGDVQKARAIDRVNEDWVLERPVLGNRHWARWNIAVLGWQSVAGP